MATPTCERPSDAHSEAFELSWFLDSLLNLSASAERSSLTGQDVHGLLMAIKAKADRVLSALS